MLLGSELRFVKSQAAGLLAGCAMMLFVAGFDYHIFIRKIFSEKQENKSSAYFICYCTCYADCRAFYRC